MLNDDDDTKNSAVQTTNKKAGQANNWTYSISIDDSLLKENKDD